MPIGFAPASRPFAVATVIATLGRPRLVRAAVDSALRQRTATAEIVLVNDGGRVADTAPAALGPPAPAVRLSVVCLARTGGHVAARNLAVRLTQSDAVALLDDDDLWLPDHLSGLAAALQAGADLAYSDAELVYVDRSAPLPMRVLGRRLFALEAGDDFPLRYNPVVPSGMAVRRDLFEALDGFSVESDHHWDWDFLLRARAAGADVRRVPRATVVYTLDRGGDNQSARSAEMRTSVTALGRRHGLPNDAVHTFWSMLDEPDVRSRLVPSERSWDGTWPGLISDGGAASPPA